MDMTLVLDQSYRVHRTVSWQRAIHMLFDDKIEILEEYEEEIRSPSLTIKKPAVVRLLKKVKAKKNAAKFSRLNVAVRDNFTCQYCAQQMPISRLTYDHVVPRSKGGTTKWENIVMACRPCNSHKGDRTPEQANLRLLKAPVKPKYLPAVSGQVNMRRETHELWIRWLPERE